MTNTTTNSINHSSPLFMRFNEWAKERFPLANIISGSLSYITMVSIGRFVAETPITNFGVVDIIGALAFIGHLLLLRIFDEHKDFEVDKLNHPQRALSRGLITLKHLRILAYPLPLLSLLWCYLSYSQSVDIFIIWFLLMGYSFLMAKEFFIGEWLSKRLTLYSISHMMVSPIMILWVIIGGSGNLNLTNLIIFVLAVSFTSGISYELTRKTRGSDEDPALDNYNSSFGTNGCIAIISVFNLMSFILCLLILSEINKVHFTGTVVLALGYISTFYPTINFLKKSTEKARKMSEGGLGLFFLGLYSSILVTLFI